MIGRIIQAAVGLFVYIIVYLALRLLPDQAYAGYFNTGVQVVGDALCAIIAFHAARSSDITWRGFFNGIGIASVFLLIANFAWGIVINVWAIDPNTTLESLLYRIPYLLCLAFWAFAWMNLVIRQINRGAGISLFLTALLVGGALAALLVQYYGPLIFDSSNPHRVFVFLYVGLEIAALLFSTGAAIIEIHPYPVLIAVGYAMLVAADFVFNTNELRGTTAQNSLVEIPWTSAQILVALGLKVQREILAGQGHEKEAPESNVNAHFAIPLLSVTLGAGLIGSLITRFVRPDTAALGCYLFVTAVTAIAISVLARTHTRALGQALGNVFGLTKRGRLPAVIQHKREVLRLFGSAALLEQVQDHLKTVRGQTVPCGSDRLFPLEDAWTIEKRHQIFIAMPFTQSWSPTIGASFRRVISELGCTALRADELFETRDTLDGIWKGICESKVVVADLTGRNPNVLYEVGIAHCLAKPVVFMCQQANDIPYDLYTRRVVLYDLDRIEEAMPKLRQAIIGCLHDEGYLLNGSQEHERTISIE